MFTPESGIVNSMYLHRGISDPRPPKVISATQ